MKKLITILLASGLALAAVANAAQADPKIKKSAPKTNAVKQVAPKQNFAPRSHVQSVHTQHVQNLNSTKIHQTNVSGPKLHKSSTVHSNNLRNVQSSTTSKNLKSTTTNKPVVTSNQLPAVQKNQKNIVAPNTKPIPNVQNIQAKYKNFKAQPKPAVIPSAQFNQNYQIAGAQNWSGPQYQVFASYHPQWHDRGWYQSTYGANVLLIGGGWYFWNAGYWYPAWGYDQTAAYYPYDGPIYVGKSAKPFDQIVADVQTVLQERGLYKGEVDGLVGPQTQEALAAYQTSQNLEPTAAIDQPTLESLGMAG
jgi:hypothetical protein